MDCVRLLPEKVANQIAAGEVVIRPSSVVKEMMENSIDAHSEEVIVNYREGGYELIQICDNGRGMSPNDARMAFDRHATSKIASVEDIYALRTFGFRGEALASIGAVARVELRTRQQGDEMGTLTEVQGGDFISQSAVMCEVGSQFMVRDLFYNIPVRRKFAEKSTTSANQIKAEFKRVALCYPHIRFELYGNDAPLYSLPPSTLAGRIVDIVGRSIKQNLLETTADTTIVKIKGYVGRPSAAKKSNSEQYLFVNGRFFRSPYFVKAILKGYEKLMPEGLNPSFFIFLEIDPDRIDVNVHPQKTEVKFSDEDAIWQIINAAVREALAKSGVVPMMEFDDLSPIDIPVATKGALYAEPRSNSLSDYNPFNEDYISSAGGREPIIEDFTGFDVPYRTDADGVVSTPPVQVKDVEYESYQPYDYESSFEMIESPSQSPQMSFDMIESGGGEPLTLSGGVPIAGGYISAQLGGDLVIIDSKRAKERILYDHYMTLLTSGSAISQQLLFPQRLVLSISDYEVMEERATEFALLGFDVDYCGDCTIEVRGVPADESTQDIDTLIYELLRQLATPTSVEQQRLERLALTMAHSGSRVRRATYSAEEAQSLIKELSASSDVSYSPSGKEIFWRITVDDIKKKLI